MHVNVRVLKDLYMRVNLCEFLHACDVDACVGCLYMRLRDVDESLCM